MAEILFVFMQLFLKTFSGMANCVDPIRMPLKELSDLGLLCLHMQFVRNSGKQNFRIFPISPGEKKMIGAQITWISPQD